ncbi:MAG TPA: response regulator transcription factor, partial [Chloroflexi bacterium]|nr:response regulator transcription factor [Chloroflexota bacterium]
MNDEIIRILIVDDHIVVRKGIKALLATEPTLEVLDEAEDGLEAIAKYEELKPDVLLLDLLMPKMSGIEVIRELKSKYSAVKILVLTSFAADEQVFPAIKAGALGYLLKDS